MSRKNANDIQIKIKIKIFNTASGNLFKMESLTHHGMYICVCTYDDDMLRVMMILMMTGRL